MTFPTLDSVLETNDLISETEVQNHTQDMKLFRLSQSYASKSIKGR